MLVVSKNSLPPSTPFYAPADDDDEAGGHGSSAITRISLAPLAPLEFVEGSSSDSLAPLANKYPPINLRPPSNQSSPPAPSNRPRSDVADLPEAVSPARTAGQLYRQPLVFSYPPNIRRPGAGLFNMGNTCFVNSVLQCLINLPPVLSVLMAHNLDSCQWTGSSCATCMLRSVFTQSLKKCAVPRAILQSLPKIAKHMRGGRQEDAHEFLRFFIDALQTSSLPRSKAKLDPKIAETSWVHQVFGGTLRSRVKCRECGHPSDTFDSILDLSIDVSGVSSLKEALHKFVKLDILKGTDSYKCERCRRPVVAEKGFTLYKAPAVLTIHLKRFTPMGRKLTHPVRFDQTLDLAPYVSEDSFGPQYRLIGVICHAGSGPNSGHYYAFVRGSKPNDSFYEVNDDQVEPRNAPFMSEKNAYILFYMQQKGEYFRQQLSFKSTPQSNDRKELAVSTVAPRLPVESRQIGVALVAANSQGPETPHRQSLILREKIRNLEAQQSTTNGSGQDPDSAPPANMDVTREETKAERQSTAPSRYGEDIGELVLSKPTAASKRLGDSPESPGQTKRLRLDSPDGGEASEALGLTFSNIDALARETGAPLTFSSMNGKTKAVKPRAKKRSMM